MPFWGGGLGRFVLGREGESCRYFEVVLGLMIIIILGLLDL